MLTSSLAQHACCTSCLLCCCGPVCAATHACLPPPTGAEFDVVGGTDVQLTFSSPHGTVLASNVTTTSVAAHPSKQL